MIAIILLEIYALQHKNLTFGTKPDLCRLVEFNIDRRDSSAAAGVSMIVM